MKFCSSSFNFFSFLLFWTGQWVFCISDDIKWSQKMWLNGDLIVFGNVKVSNDFNWGTRSEVLKDVRGNDEPGYIAHFNPINIPPKPSTIIIIKSSLWHLLIKFIWIQSMDKLKSTRRVIYANIMDKAIEGSRLKTSKGKFWPWNCNLNLNRGFTAICGEFPFRFVRKTIPYWRTSS